MVYVKEFMVYGPIKIEMFFSLIFIDITQHTRLRVINLSLIFTNHFTLLKTMSHTNTDQVSLDPTTLHDTESVDESNVELDKLIDTHIKLFDEWIDMAKLKKQKYQEQGIRFLLQKELEPKPIRGCKGGIVADEMGLGKTVMTLGLIISHKVKHTLIVVPPALLEQWETECMRLLGHTPLVYHGTKKNDKPIHMSPIVITTYGTLSSDNGENLLTQFSWSRVIFDEAHRLRNPKAIVHKAALRLKSSYYWCLTGTPIQNKLLDIISLCKIIKISGADSLHINDLDWVIENFMIKRTKKQVNIELPPINIEDISVDWITDEESNLAHDLHSMMNFTNITTANVNKLVYLLSTSTLPALMRMRQVCTMPLSMYSAIQRMIDEGVVDQSDIDIGIRGTSKMSSVVAKLKENKDNGNKKIVFTHFKMETTYLTMKLETLGFKVASIGGSTTRSQREAILMDNSLDVLILQINTASEGLNLQTYNEVYFTAPHWNPSIEDQAIARAHRIGQTKPVFVYRFYMKGFGEDSKSIDQYILLIQQNKRTLTQIFQ
jgi:SNF2 family DNA or RNA helicase